MITVLAFPGVSYSQVYNLSYETDVPMISLGVALLGGRYFLEKEQEPLSEKEILTADRSDVNRFDRPATHNWSEKSDRWSDYTLFALMAGQLVLFSFKEPRNDILIITVMYLESLTIETGMTGIFKSAINRKRPYVYNEDVPLDKKRNKYSVKSFYSGHAASAFNSTVFLGTVFSDYFPESGFRYAVWSLSLILASVTGYLRYTAGMHYPSDIIAGAVAGSITGYLVPAMHRNKANIITFVPFIMPGASGILMEYRF